jgi:hypothetical protein
MRMTFTFILHHLVKFSYMPHAFIFRENKPTSSDYIDLTSDYKGDLLSPGRVGESFQYPENEHCNLLTRSPFENVFRTVTEPGDSIYNSSHESRYVIFSRFLAKSGRRLFLYDDCELRCYSHQNSVVWSSNVAPFVNKVAPSPDEDHIVAPTSLGTLDIVRVSDGSTVCTLTIRVPCVDTRIVSLEWNPHNILIGFANGFLELIKIDSSNRIGIGCNVPIFGASQSSDGSLVAVYTSEFVTLYSSRSAQILLSIKADKFVSTVTNAKWIMSYGDNRLAVTHSQTVQWIAIKDPKSVCLFDESMVVHTFDSSLCLEKLNEDIKFSIKSEYVIESVLGHPSEPLFVASMHSQTDSIIRIIDRTGNDYIPARCFVGTTAVRACDYCGTKIACTDGEFVILVFGDYSIAYLSIHSPIVSQTGFPPLSSRAHGAQDDIVVDMSFGGPELLAVARKSGIVQLYGIDGDALRLTRSVRATSDYSPCTIFVSERFAVLLDAASTIYCGDANTLDMKKLLHRSACWKFVVSPGGEYIGVSDRDCVFIYRTESVTEPVLVEVIRVGIDTELVGILRSEMVLFNWRTRKVDQISIRPVREWGILTKSSPHVNTKCLVDFVKANSCQRLWKELSKELILRGEYAEARKCMAETKDWLTTVLVDGLIQRKYDTNDITSFFASDGDAEIICESSQAETDEFLLSFDSPDPSRGRNWKSFSSAGIIIMCETLLREGDITSLIMVLEQIDLSVHPQLRSFLLDMLDLLLLSNETRVAIRVCILQLNDIQLAMEIVIKYNGWNDFIDVMRNHNMALRLSDDEIKRVLKVVADSGYTPKAALCLIVLARRANTETCQAILADLCNPPWAPMGYIPHQLCFDIAHRLTGSPRSFSQGLIRYTNAHVALYSGDPITAFSEIMMISQSDTVLINYIDEESILCMRALSALLSSKQGECSKAFTKLQTCARVSHSRRELYRKLSLRIFGGEAAWGRNTEM